MSTELVIGVNAKYCSKCGELKSYINFTARKRNKDGKESQCKTCIKSIPSNSTESRKLVRRKHYENNSDYYIHKSRERYANKTDQCRKASNDWKYRNWSHVLEYSKSYYKDNQEKCLSDAALYRDVNREALSERNKIQFNKDIEKSRNRVRQWQINNPEKYAVNCAKRRYRCMQSTPVWLTNDDKNSIASFYILAKELGKAAELKFHVDHIIPLKHDLVCGLHVPWNLQVLTAKENCSKHNKFTVE